jgi:hypothetical protein
MTIIRSMVVTRYEHGAAEPPLGVGNV